MTTKREVTMTVYVTVEFPDKAHDTSKERAVELAMSAVTQYHQVDCGPVGRIVWADVYAEVSDDNCVAEDWS